MFAGSPSSVARTGSGLAASQLGPWAALRNPDPDTDPDTGPDTDPRPASDLR